jgi:hypothetical protein
MLRFVDRLYNNIRTIKILGGPFTFTLGNIQVQTKKKCRLFLSNCLPFDMLVNPVCPIFGSIRARNIDQFLWRVVIAFVLYYFTNDIAMCVPVHVCVTRHVSCKIRGNVRSNCRLKTREMELLGHSYLTYIHYVTSTFWTVSVVDPRCDLGLGLTYA